MHLFRGYTDLRLNRSSHTTDTSLWPSFTDIMTVILMVFMLTMVVVIIKNADLIDQIRLSRQLQAESEERLQENLQAMVDLRVRNTDLEEGIREARMEIILLTDEARRLESSLDIKAAAIARMEGMKDEAELANSRLNLQIAELLSRLKKNEATLLMLSDEKSNLEMTLARQRQDFSSLEDKYLRLVRPARSSMGKQVVSVQFFRKDGQLKYMLKDIGGNRWEPMSRIKVFGRLGALKERWGEELYIKIVIPDDSGLTYNEAWGFTKVVLSEFDYYYIEGW